jgi:hypothetical protein
MKALAKLLRIAGTGAALTVWTWLWFLPVAGFHHMYRCGLLGWAVLDEENGPLEIRWSLTLLLASAVLWLLPVAFLSWLVLKPRQPISS